MKDDGESLHNILVQNLYDLDAESRFATGKLYENLGRNAGLVHCYRTIDLQGSKPHRISLQVTRSMEERSSVITTLHLNEPSSSFAYINLHGYAGEHVRSQDGSSHFSINSESYNFELIKNPDPFHETYFQTRADFKRNIISIKTFAKTNHPEGGAFKDALNVERISFLVHKALEEL